MTTSPLPTDLPQQRTAPAPQPPAAGRGWLWAGVGAGLLGVASTMGAVLGTPEPEVYQRGSEAVRDSFTGSDLLLAGAGAALVGAVLLVPFALGLVAHLRRTQAAPSWLADVVRTGLSALVAGLFLTVSLRYVAVGGMPGGIDADYYTATDSTALAMLGSQMQFAGWLPGLLATGALAYGAVRSRAVPVWAGVLAGLLTALSAGMTLLLGLPYSAGLVVPLSLLLVSAALLLRRG